VCRCQFPEDASVADVVAEIKQQKGVSAILTLPNNHVLGLSDHHRSMRELLDSSPCAEKRTDPHDSRCYTKREFFSYYGTRQGQQVWDRAIPVEEVAYAESLRDATLAENAMVSEAVLRSRHECDGSSEQVTPIKVCNFPAILGVADTGMTEHDSNDEIVRGLVLGFNKHPAEFKEAIYESALAQSLINRGIIICPEWANEATILIEGLTPSMLQEGGFAPVELKRWHVVVFEENEKDVMDSLSTIRFRKRPKQKTRALITFRKRPKMHVPREESCHQEEYEAEGEDGTASDDEPQCLNQDPATSLPEEFCVTRTFIDVPKHLCVGCSPRSAYTKSSTDRHGIENPRKWK